MNATPDTSSTWTVNVLTLFPEMFPGPLGHSLAGRALVDGLWSLKATDIRSFATDKHRTVDDTPFGGGASMVMRPDVIDAALDSVKSPGTDMGPVIYLSPRGKLFDQATARRLAASPALTILCGRFEGIDQRVIDARQLEEISIGDFILSGGEPAAITMIDACVRLLPGVVGNTESLTEESFEQGLLEYPLYTRPQSWCGRAVPEVLLSGHHEKIRAWRLAQAEEVTRVRRPDLWDRYVAHRHQPPTRP